MSPQTTRSAGMIGLLGFVLACLAALFLGWLSEEMMEGDTKRFDAYVRASVHAASSPAMTSVMRFFTDVGSVAVLPCLLAVSLLAFWMLGWRFAAGGLVITMAGAAVLDEVLKLSFHRARPVPFFGIPVPHSFSYPSGHSLFSFVFFSTLASLLTVRMSDLKVRILVWSAAGSLIFLIGFSRIYLGVHYPTDVIAGYTTGFIWVISVSLADRLYWRRHRERAARRPDAHDRAS